MSKRQWYIKDDYSIAFYDDADLPPKALETKRLFRRIPITEDLAEQIEFGRKIIICLLSADKADLNMEAFDEQEQE